MKIKIRNKILFAGKETLYTEYNRKIQFMISIGKHKTMCVIKTCPNDAYL